MRSAAVLAVLTAATAAARAAPVPEPTGPHPRMLLDDELRAALRAAAAADRGPVASALRICNEARTTDKYRLEGYQGSDWAKALQSCLISWAATDAPEHAATAIRYFTALLDDLEVIGDRKGGDASGQRDDGYAIRNLGPFTAIAYDWLHDAPGMTPVLRAKARDRWDGWLTWYRKHGYRARFPATNYHAGFLVAATTIAIAQSGEAGPLGTELWRFVADEMWGKDMAAALAPGGILDGGDWLEGWQYGPLSVGNYALAMRVARRAGIRVDGVEAWLTGILRRHVHALTPTDQTYAGGDTQLAAAHHIPRELTLSAVAFGDAPAQERRWAKGELERLGLADDDALLFDSLRVAGPPGEPIPRASWPTWYLARAAGALYTRTRWDERAVWFVAECQRKLPVDHRFPNAGNFVLTRGRDDVIVDPSPYGSLSTLTGNAPTVASGVLHPGQVPSQGRRSLLTRWWWATQTRSGVVAARCDYADQYRAEIKPSDVREAIRDLILLPSEDGTDAALVIVDRAISGAEGRAMHLRFRVPAAGALALEGDTAAATIGATRLAIAGLHRSAGRPALVTPSEKTCPEEKTAPRGQCEGARIPVTDYRLAIAGPEPRAVHAITATGGPAPPSVPFEGEGWLGVRVAAARDAVVVWPRARGAVLRYRAPRGKAVTHVVLDAPAAAGIARVTARVDADACAVEVEAAAAADEKHGIPARPLIATLDDACAIAADPPRPTQGATVTPPDDPPAPPAPPPDAPKPRRKGCCDASGAEPPLLVLLPIAAVILRRIRGRGRARGRRGFLARRRHVAC